MPLEKTNQVSAIWWAPLLWLCVLGILCQLAPVYSQLHSLWPAKQQSALQLLDSHASLLISLPCITLIFLILGLRKPKTSNPSNATLLFTLTFCAALLSLAAALLELNWLHIASTLLTTTCLLAHCTRRNFLQVSGWMIPMFLLVLLPTHSGWDLRVLLQQASMQSISLLLEFAQIPNMLDDGKLLFEGGHLSGAILVRWLVEPYKLLAIASCITLLSRIKLITATSVLLMIIPLCWFSGTIYGAAGILLYVQDIANLFSGTTAVWMNLVSFLMILGMSWLFAKASLQFWTPFENVPPDSLHATFNSLITFPDGSNDTFIAKPKSRPNLHLGLGIACLLVFSVSTAIRFWHGA